MQLERGIGKYKRKRKQKTKLFLFHQYFELHRGIYTTHALCKKYNRSSELLLRDLEMLASFAYLMDRDTYS
jgi:alpha-mannosidase